MELRALIEAIEAGRVRISDHADEEAQADRLTFDAIYVSVLHGEIIEDYRKANRTRVVWSMAGVVSQFPWKLASPGIWLEQ
ncbi:DUF4258 domain-containing protein [Nitrospira sp. Kam-Ns4a]